MRTRTARLLLFSALLAAAYSSPLLADDQPLPERPRLENYRDYNQFLLDMAAYKKRMRELEAAKAATLAHPTLAPAPVVVAKTEAVIPTQTVEQAVIPQTSLPAQPVSVVDPANESSPPPLIVDGPEDLDNAVEKAKSFPHPVYKVTRRYNRSTAQSFPLPQLQPQELEGNAVDGMWVSKATLPEDQAAMNKGILDQQGQANEDSKLLKKKKTATKKAQDEEDAAMDNDHLTRVLGTPIEMVLAPVQIQHFTVSDYQSSAIIDLSVTPATIQTTVHP